MQIGNVHRTVRDVALARVAGLLAEEDMDRCPWLRVRIDGQATGAGITAAPVLEPWGMAETPASLIQQRTEGYTAVGLAPGWDRYIPPAISAGYSVQSQTGYSHSQSQLG